MRQLIILFHALIGLSIGFFAGTTAGLPTLVAFSLGGCALGMLAGLVTCYLPRMIRSAAKIVPRNPVLALLVLICAHLVWAIITVPFWWLCIDLFTGSAPL
jgi:hypothetical protein